MELIIKDISQPLNIRILQELASANPYLVQDEALLLSYYKRIRETWSSSAIKNLQKETDLKLTNKLNRCQFAINAAKKQLQFSLNSNSKVEEKPTTEKSIKRIGNREQAIEKSEQGITRYLEGDLDLSKTVPAFSDRAKYQYNREHHSPVPCSPSPVPSETTTDSEAIILQLETQLKEQYSKLQKQEEELTKRQEELERQKAEKTKSARFTALLLTHRLLLPGLPLNGTEESPAMRVLGSPKTLTELEAFLSRTN